MTFTLNQITELGRPPPRDSVRETETAGGKVVRSISKAYVTTRMNEIFLGEWDRRDEDIVRIRTDGGTIAVRGCTVTVAGLQFRADYTWELHSDVTKAVEEIHRSGAIAFKRAVASLGPTLGLDLYGDLRMDPMDEGGLDAWAPAGDGSRQASQPSRRREAAVSSEAPANPQAPSAAVEEPQSVADADGAPSSVPNEPEAPLRAAQASPQAPPQTTLLPDDPGVRLGVPSGSAAQEQSARHEDGAIAVDGAVASAGRANVESQSAQNGAAAHPARDDSQGLAAAPLDRQGLIENHFKPRAQDLADAAANNPVLKDEGLKFNHFATFASHVARQKYNGSLSDLTEAQMREMAGLSVGEIVEIVSTYVAGRGK